MTSYKKPLNKSDFTFYKNLPPGITMTAGGTTDGYLREEPKKCVRCHRLIQEGEDYCVHAGELYHVCCLEGYCPNCG